MRKLFPSGVCLAFLCHFVLVDLSAQNITEKNWFFGSSQNNLVFDKSGRDVVLEDDNNTLFGVGGSAVINDQFTGDLIFYTDGALVLDANHAIIPGVLGGTVLSGNTSKNQAVATCPVPGSLTQYYVFTNSDTAINYTVLDASIAGNSTSARFPTGDILGAPNLSMALPNPSEGMAIIETGDGLNYWLFTQDQTSFEFHITLIDGSFTTRDTTIFSGTLPGFEINQIAQKIDTTGLVKLALAPKNANRNILLLDFDPITGDIAINNSLRNTGREDEIYDVEWSGDGSKLYFSVLGNNTNAGEIFQINFSDTVDIDPYLVQPVLTQPVFRSYGLRRGIDNRIYHLYQTNQGDPFNLGRVEFANNTVNLLVYNPMVFGEDFEGTQFPTFAPPQLPTFTNVSFDYRDSCFNQITQFFADVTPEPNNYFWNFGDGSFSNAAAPLKEYGAAGSYNVSLIAELNGRIGRSMDFMLNIIAADSADLGADTTICPGSQLILDPGVTGANTYVWNTGATTPTILADADTTRTYWVNVTGANGCTSYDDIEVTVYLSQPLPPSSQWYFGEQAGIDFTNGAQAITDANMMTSPEGCASISDANGDLLFYTNGSTVWNKEHDVMINGIKIGGDSSSAQSALIIPFSSDDTFFYIFTTEEVYGDDTYQLKYSIVDIKEDTARGKVIKKGVSLVSRSSERVTSSGFDSPILLTHEFGNNNYRVYQINGSGISSANHSSIGEPHDRTVALSNSGYMKLSPILTDVAVLIPGNQNQLELLDYNLFTGAIENPRLIDLQEPTPAEAYGLEYSTSGQKLYVSISDNPTSRILQYDLDSINSANAAIDIENTKEIIIGPTLPDYGSLQMGPDGVIYVAIDNHSFVGSIGNPEVDGSAGSQVNESAINIDPNGEGRLSRKGLPNFTQTGGTGSQPSAFASLACVGQTTSFSGTGLDPNQHVETYNWDFGDGTFSGELSSPDTTHVYTSAIDTLATLTIQGCTGLMGDTTLTLTVPIQSFFIPEEPLVPTDTALCGGTVTLSIWDMDDPSLFYYWSTGETTRTVTFTEPGIVDAAIINIGSGCSSDTVRVFIGDGSNFVDLGSDLLYCQFDPVDTLNANVGNSTYSWQIDDTVVGDELEQVISTGIAGTFTYSVAVTNIFTGCTVRDSIDITILEAPEILQADIIPPDCGETNGAFSVEFTELGSYSYELNGDTIAGPFTFDGPGVTPAIQGLGAGTYILNATNTVTGCINTEVMLLEDDGPYEMEAISQNGCLRSGDIRVILRNFRGTRVDVSVLNNNGDSIYQEDNRSASNIIISDLDTGLYYVTTRQVVEPQCIQTDTVRLQAEIACFRNIAAPNAFSPNGNDRNEEFFVFPSDFINTFEIFIYNRWGQIVFNSKDPNFRWDGTFQNQPAPPTTYAYKMIFTSTVEPDIAEIIQYGSVTLIR